MATLVSMTNPVVIVVGAGPGIGAAVARRFGQAGYAPALIARSADKLEQLGQQLQSEGFTTGWTAVDVTDGAALTAAIERFGGFSGTIGHLHFNPSAFTAKDALTITADELLGDLRLGVASLLTAVQAARPFMSAGARITATGGATADRPWAKAASLGVQKAALRNLVTALDTALAPGGIRAMSLTVAGDVKVGTPFDPDHIAEAIYEASQTDSEFWSSEIRFTGRE
jgi:NADP-dependent 3-hydroxy acid dehydrogenase YdfG